MVPRIAKPEGGWKLNSKALFDRDKLRALQTGYGEAMAPLGIRRGEPGSKAKHVEVSQFYGAVMAERPPMPKLGLVAGDFHHLHVGQLALLEESAGGLVAQVVEFQIRYGGAVADFPKASR